MIDNHIKNHVLRGCWVAGLDDKDAEHLCTTHYECAVTLFHSATQTILRDLERLPRYDRPRSHPFAQLRQAATAALSVVEKWAQDVLANEPLNPPPPPPPKPEPEPEPEIEFEAITAEGPLLPQPYTPPPPKTPFFAVAPLTDMD